jgi:hypothetical protein
MASMIWVEFGHLELLVLHAEGVLDYCSLYSVCVRRWEWLKVKHRSCFMGLRVAMYADLFIIHTFGAKIRVICGKHTLVGLHK